MSKSFNPIAMFTGGGEEPVVAPVQTPAAAPVEPEGPTAKEQAAAKAEEDKKKKKAAQGAGGTILTGSMGVQTDEQTAGKKTLLGA